MPHVPQEYVIDVRLPALLAELAWRSVRTESAARARGRPRKTPPWDDTLKGCLLQMQHVHMFSHARLGRTILVDIIHNNWYQFMYICPRPAAGPRACRRNETTLSTPMLQRQ